MSDEYSQIEAYATPDENLKTYQSVCEQVLHHIKGKAVEDAQLIVDVFIPDPMRVKEQCKKDIASSQQTLQGASEVLKVWKDEAVMCNEHMEVAERDLEDAVANHAKEEAVQRAYFEELNYRHDDEEQATFKDIVKKLNQAFAQLHWKQQEELDEQIRKGGDRLTQLTDAKEEASADVGFRKNKRKCTSTRHLFDHFKTISSNS